MDDKIKELFAKVKAGAAVVGEKAEDLGSRMGEKMSRTVEVSRLNLKIMDITASINEDLRELGQIVYDTHRGDERSGAQRMEELLETLDGKNEELAALRVQAAEARGTELCSVCGAELTRDSRYCKDCGAPRDV